MNIHQMYTPNKRNNVTMYGDGRLKFEVSSSLFHGFSILIFLFKYTG